jgi:aminopeptidase N
MILPLLLLLQDAAAPPQAVHTAHRYEITLIPADTGTHLLGEVQTTWTLRSGEPVAALLDSSMRVVRVLVDGRPNTRLSRTMYGRSGQDVVVPHQKQAGDSISTRIRYHGLVRGDAWIGEEPGGRVFVATGALGTRHWLPVPPGPPQRVGALFNVQAPLDRRALANGVLTGIDTLPYGHATWHYRLDSLAPIRALAVVVGRFAVSRPAPLVQLWTSPEDSVRATSGPFRRAGDMVDRLTTVLGQLPYPRVVHVLTAGVPELVAGGGLAFYPVERLREGELGELDVARATARQWLDGADSVLAAELSSWLAAELIDGRPPGTPRRVSELRAKLGDAAFRRGLRTFVRSQREGRGTAEDFSTAMQPAQ